MTPFAIRKVVNWLRKEYGQVCMSDGQMALPVLLKLICLGQSVPIVITENGVSDRIGNLDDLQRVYFLKHYINQLLKGGCVFSP